ncbi:MAG: hypothetical protein QG619_878, partial [Pseudomonadota bacterium]|nr:hypothetical protein [Pseudomonadota bacterium]
MLYPCQVVTSTVTANDSGCRTPKSVSVKQATRTVPALEPVYGSTR